MAHFPATNTVAGVMSPTDKGKLDNLLVTGESQLAFHIALIPSSATGAGPGAAVETTASYVVKQRVYVDFDLLDTSGTTLKGKFDVRGFLPNAGSTGDVRLFNATDAVELGVIAYTGVDLTPTQKSVLLGSIPASGLKLIEMQMRKPIGTGPGFEIDTASMMLYMES